jgi:hypothetical protein
MDGDRLVGAYKRRLEHFEERRRASPSDFLGFTPKKWMTFNEAREFVRGLRLRGQAEHREWAAGRLRGRCLQLGRRASPRTPIKCTLRSGKV